MRRTETSAEPDTGKYRDTKGLADLRRGLAPPRPTSSPRAAAGGRCTSLPRYRPAQHASCLNHGHPCLQVRECFSTEWGPLRPIWQCGSTLPVELRPSVKNAGNLAETTHNGRPCRKMPQIPAAPRRRAPSKTAARRRATKEFCSFVGDGYQLALRVAARATYPRLKRAKTRNNREEFTGRLFGYRGASVTTWKFFCSS